MEQGLQLVHHCLCCSFLSLQGSCQDPAQASHGIRTLGIPLLRCGLLQVDFCSLCSREIPAPAPGASPDPSAPTCGLQGCAPTFLTPPSSSSCCWEEYFPFPIPVIPKSLSAADGLSQGQVPFGSVRKEEASEVSHWSHPCQNLSVQTQWSRQEFDRKRNIAIVSVF